MKSPIRILCVLLLSLSAFAEVKYTPYGQSIPRNGILEIDFNFDEVQDAILQSKVGQYECQSGDNWYWQLESVLPSVATEFTGALRLGEVIGTGNSFNSNSELAYYSNGECGLVVQGAWYNRLNRYMGVKFSDIHRVVHYGWVQLSDVAYLDREGNLQVETWVTGWAYETIGGMPIVAGDRGGN